MNSSGEEAVLSRIDGDVGRIILNRPRALNALSYDMIVRIGELLERWREDPAVSLVLFEGEGERGFCAGGDVKALHGLLGEGGRMADAEGYFATEYSMNFAIVSYPKPVVAIANGVTMGGGIGVAGNAQVRIVTETSLLAMPETRLGFSPDCGGQWLLAQAPGRIGEFLALTSTAVGAADAVFARLADHVIPTSHLPSFVDALQTRADPGSPSELALLFDETPATGPLELAQPWIDEAFGADTVPEIADRLAAMGDAHGDAELSPRAALRALRERSPVALTVTLAALRAARAMTDRRAELQHELDLMVWYLHTQPDVVEGIRAQLVDKDFAPHWQQADLADVPEDIAREAIEYRSGLTIAH